MSLIQYSVEARVAVIAINRAEKRNAMTFAMVSEFFERIAQASEDPEVGAVIITGAPGAFCSGTDLSAVSGTFDPHDEGALERRLEAERELHWAIVKCPKPTIAAVDGPAVGMGAEFACQCDVRIATPRGRFAWNFVHRGLVPDRGAANWLLPRQVGLSAALRFLYSGDFMSAEEALQLGFVAAVVPPETLAETAMTMAQRFAAGSPLAIRLSKELVYRGLGIDWQAHVDNNHAAMRICVKSDDHREGVAAFVEKRTPRFTGK